MDETLLWFWNGVNYGAWVAGLSFSLLLVAVTLGVIGTIFGKKKNAGSN